MTNDTSAITASISALYMVGAAFIYLSYGSSCHIVAFAQKQIY